MIRLRLHDEPDLLIGLKNKKNKFKNFKGSFSFSKGTRNVFDLLE